MKKIEKWSEKIGKYFEKGKPLYPLHSFFDAVDTFLLTPKEVTNQGCHIRDAVDMKRTMITVIIALFPPLLFGLWNIGYHHFLSHGITASIGQAFWYGFLKWLPLVITVYVSGLGVEIFFAQRRGHQVAEGFFVTGFLIPMILPPDIPLWIVALATIFAVIFGKEVFGGTGYNFLNPALLARAFIFFAYPSVISGDRVWIADKADAYSGATPLAEIMNGNITQLPSMLELCIGNIPGSIGETSKIAILIGAFILIITRVANVKIMISTLVGGVIMGAIFNWIGANPIMQIPIHEQLLMGGFLFGAVYMATDPVTAPHTSQGKIVYGLLIGIFAILIRVANKGYPEGMMLAILLMNIFAPLIDYCVIQFNIRKRLLRTQK